MAMAILDFFCFYERLHFRSREPVSFGARKFMADVRWTQEYIKYWLPTYGDSDIFNNERSRIEPDAHTRNE